VVDGAAAVGGAAAGGGAAAEDCADAVPSDVGVGVEVAPLDLLYPAAPAMKAALVNAIKMIRVVIASPP
jgi:hypothetical protein